MTDTTPDAAEVQRRVLREMPLTRKAGLTVNLCQVTRDLALAGIRSRHPEYSLREAQLALWRMLYGDDLFGRAWPAAPRLAP